MSAGEKACPPAARDERATLDRIGAPPDVRLACQLRPQGDLSVIPLVRTERADLSRRPRRGATPSARSSCCICDFLNRAELAADHMPQDLLYVLTLYIEGLSNAIRAPRGTLSYIELDSLCALFGSSATRAGGAPGAAGGRRDRAGDGRAQRAAGAAVGLQGERWRSASISAARWWARSAHSTRRR